MSTYDLKTLFDKLGRLRLNTFVAALETLRDQEPERLAPFASQLEQMADQELADRTDRTVARRIHEARFVRIQTVDAFDFAYNASTKALRRTFLRLLQADHVAQGLGAIFVGNSGLGKTHLARALGYAACQRGQRVLFLPCTTLLNRLVAADATKDLERTIKNLLSPALLLIDELAYITMSQAEANLFFQVISRRHDHHRPTVVTTNKPFQEWNQVFHSDATAHAIVDRLTESAEIFYLEGKSYRQTHRTKLSS
jgi:DNA replication protein DnaC